LTLRDDLGMRISKWAGLALLAAVSVTACASLTGSPKATFKNNDAGFEPKGLMAVVQWQWGAFMDGLPKPPQQPTPTVAPDLAFIHANSGGATQPAVTWIGHATVLAQLGGLNVLTDPIFSERASPFSFAGPKRAQPPGLSLATLPRIDVVLISHNHYDHLDEQSVRALASQKGGAPLYLVPMGNGAWFKALGISSVVDMAWWQSHKVQDVEFVFTPVQHWSGRGLNDRLQTLWGGFAVLAPDSHLYFGGDTGYSGDFKRTREHLVKRQTPAEGGGFDIALLPIGAYEPRDFMRDQHVNPEEAVQIHRDLGAKRSMAMHYGTFELTNESLDEPPKALAQAKLQQGVADEAFTVPAVGQTLRLQRRP
jgi:N-acyl-phosphatidylethanolamine-hydrolysing phospholipase D